MERSPAHGRGQRTHSCQRSVRRLFGAHFLCNHAGFAKAPKPRVRMPIRSRPTGSVVSSSSLSADRQHTQLANVITVISACPSHDDGATWRTPSVRRSCTSCSLSSLPWSCPSPPETPDDIDCARSLSRPYVRVKRPHRRATRLVLKTPS